MAGHRRALVVRCSRNEHEPEPSSGLVFLQPPRSPYPPPPTETDTRNGYGCGADDILIEILVRIGFPTNLLRAALVCKRWLGHVSNPAFLRRFRELHPPRLLGVYVEEMGLHPYAPPFIPVFSKDPEIADVIGRADFSLDDYDNISITTHDCQNGSVFITFYEYRSDCGVHSPLWPERGLTIIPPLPEESEEADSRSFSQVLSRDDGDGALSYFYLLVESTEGFPEPDLKVCIHLHVLQDGSWLPRHSLVIDHLPHPLPEPISVLVGNKIYIPAGLNDIIVLDFTAPSLSTIQLPLGVEHGETGTTMLARADDASGVYLIHVEEFELRAWLHKDDNWLLVDIICLREMCANLGLSEEHTLLFTKQVVDYGDFLFLEMGGCALHLDIKCRTLRKVYQAKEGHLIGVNPFMMIWPPTFPAVKCDQEMQNEEEDTRKLLGGMQIVSDLEDIMEEG